jgi:hypothetical protein
MAVEYIRDEQGDPSVKVSCDGCGRFGTSDMLMDDEICGLVGWTFDFGSVWCVLCQWKRGQIPGIARRLRTTT